MSDLSVTIHNLEAMFEGKIDFAEFRDGEVALLKENIASVPGAVQPFLQIGVTALEAGASELVGVGLTAVGPALAESSDDQATLILNLLEKLGVPTGGAILSIPEHVVLTQVISGVKALADRLGLRIATNGAVPPAPADLAGAPVQGG